MQELRFDGPGHRLIIPGHDPIPVGKSDKFSDDEAAALLAQDWLHLTPVSSAPARSASKAIWQAHAAGLGISTDGLNRDQIIAAVEQHVPGETNDDQDADHDGGDPDEPEAEPGVGHTDHHEIEE